MIGAPDPLDQTLDVLGRTDLHHKVHVAPINPEVERPCAHNCAQITAHHRRLHVCALITRQRPVMNADGQTVVVRKPEVVKEEFGLRAGVVENQRGLMLLDQVQHRRDRVFGTTARPRRAFIGHQHGDVRIRPRIGQHNGARVGVARQLAGDGGGVLYGRGQSDAAQPGRHGLHAAQRQHQLVPPLAFGQRVYFIHDDALDTFEHARRILIRHQQCKALGGRQQDVRRVRALPAFLRIARVARAVFDPNGEVHVGNRRAQIAFDICRQRLQRGNIKRMQPVMRSIRQFNQ